VKVHLGEHVGQHVLCMALYTGAVACAHCVVHVCVVDLFSPLDQATCSIVLAFPITAGWWAGVMRVSVLVQVGATVCVVCWFSLKVETLAWLCLWTCLDGVADAAAQQMMGLAVPICVNR
jgi:hypothetical protein